MNNPAVAQELEQLRAAWNTAWLEKDATTVDELMTIEYVYVAPNGQVLERGRLLEIIRSPGYKIHQGTWTEVSITPLNADAGVVIERWQGSGTFNGSAFHDDHRCASVWLRRNGVWQIAFQQSSPIVP